MGFSCTYSVVVSKLCQVKLCQVVKFNYLKYKDLKEVVTSYGQVTDKLRVPFSQRGKNGLSKVELK